MASLLEQLQKKQMVPEGTPFDPENNPITKLGRASLAAAQAQLEGKSLNETVGAMREQLQPKAPEAPQGEELFKYITREKLPQVGMGMELFKGMMGRDRAVSQLPEKLGGLATEAALDVSNLLPGKLAMGTLGAVAGSMAMKGGQKASQVLAKQSDLGFYSKLEDLIRSKMGKSATPEQVMSIAKEAKAEELAGSGLEEFLKGKESVKQEDVLARLAETRPQLQEVVKGGVKGTLNSTSPYYQIPQVKRIVENEQGAAGVEMALANDGDAYRALSKKFPGVIEKENWAELIVQDIFQKAKNKEFQPTKFGQYVLSDGENYKETLITLPSAKSTPSAQKRYDELNAITDRRALSELESQEMVDLERALSGQSSEKFGNTFQSSHWQEPNVLAHARTNERVDTAGNKLFHIEEIQSDWHQKGRKKGYIPANLEKQKSNLKIQMLDETKKFFRDNDKLAELVVENAVRDLEFGRPAFTEQAPEKLRSLAQQYTELSKIRDKVPDAPFKKSWQELTAKRMVRQAVESGADRMTWTPGALQAERYDISKQVKEIDYIKNSDGTFSIGIADIRGEPVSLPKDRFSADELPDVVGKEIADKIVSDQGKQYRGREHKTLEGLDLEVGGEGMKGFYDKILPDFLRKFGKKYGAEVGETTIESGGKKIKVPFLQLTDELKKAVMEEGMPLFQVGGAVGLGGLIEQMRQKDTNEQAR